MLSKDELARINFLAKKKKSEGLSPAETEEQQELRKNVTAHPLWELSKFYAAFRSYWLMSVENKMP